MQQPGYDFEASKYLQHLQWTRDVKPDVNTVVAQVNGKFIVYRGEPNYKALMEWGESIHKMAAEQNKKSET